MFGSCQQINRDFEILRPLPERKRFWITKQRGFGGQAGTQPQTLAAPLPDPVFQAIRGVLAARQHDANGGEAIRLCGGTIGHPMGNLSVNHYARLEPYAKGVIVTWVLDLAEIPTFELMQTWNA